MDGVRRPSLETALAASKGTAPVRPNGWRGTGGTSVINPRILEISSKDRRESLAARIDKEVL